MKTPAKAANELGGRRGRSMGSERMVPFRSRSARVESAARGGGAMEAGTTGLTGEALEERLSELLETEIFEPPQEFAAAAALGDESLHREAAKDPVGWWSEQARALDWFEPWDDAL